MSHQLRWKMAIPLLGLCLALPCAVAAPADAPSRSGHSVINMQGGAAYAVVVHGHESVFFSGSGDMNVDLDSMKKSVHGDFIWFRDADKAYVIKDPAMLARATAAYQPMDKLSAQMSVYGEQMSEHSTAMNALGKKMQAARGSASEMETIGRQMEATRKPMGELGKQMGELGRQEEAASKRADASMRVLLQEALKNGKALPAPVNAG